MNRSALLRAWSTGQITNEEFALAWTLGTFLDDCQHGRPIEAFCKGCGA